MDTPRKTIVLPPKTPEQEFYEFLKELPIRCSFIQETIERAGAATDIANVLSVLRGISITVWSCVHRLGKEQDEKFQPLLEATHASDAALSVWSSTEWRYEFTGMNNLAKITAAQNLAREHCHKILGEAEKLRSLLSLPS